MNTLTLEDTGISIKIEQGVFTENKTEYVGGKFTDGKRNTPLIKFESNNPTHPENISNGGSEHNFSMLSVTHTTFQPDFNIKVEPPVDIDDRQPDVELEENTVLTSEQLRKPCNHAPKITLAPASKLIAIQNGSTDNKRRYACPYESCTKSYGKSSHLRSHLTWHTGIKPFVCKEHGCGKGFTRSDELNRHIRTHTGEKPFECIQCTKKFSRSDHLTKHLATHSKQLAASNGAKKTKLDTKVSQSVSKTLSTVAPITVNDNTNSKEFHFVRTMMKLKQTEYINSFMKVIPEPNIDVYGMSPAQQLINSLDDKCNVHVKPEPLDQSVISEFAEVSDEPNDDDIMPEANLPPLTQKQPSQSTVVLTEDTKLLKEKLRQMEDSVYDPTRPFPCGNCAKNFKRQDDLNRHMRTHTGEKPFACNQCDKRFMRSDHLKKHLKTHSKIR